VVVLTCRKEQEFIDRIVRGEETGHYYLLIGEKVMTFEAPLTAGHREEDDAVGVSVYYALV
jgi:hypothetical protein